MIATEIDFAAARAHMVDSQVRPNKVTDKRLIAALRSVQRELFLPADRTAMAYADEDVPLGNGRVLMEPMVLARIVQAAAPRAGERALVVASGTGYSAAVLAGMGLAVTALEDDAALRAIARRALPAGVVQAEGAPGAGWPAGAPYDVILIDGAVEALPEMFAAQLAPGGRLVAVLRAGGTGPGQAVLAEAFGGRLAATVLFDCAVPLLPAFRRAPGFVF